MRLFGWTKRCRELEAENQTLRERNARLEERVRQLEGQNSQLTQALAAAKKHSGNSSKPPSSDIVKPTSDRQTRRSKRRIGGQRGHPKHERAAFTADQIDERIPYRLHQCPVDSSHRIVPVEDRQRVLQQIELADKPFVITECQRRNESGGILAV
jgi:transposase